MASGTSSRSSKLVHGGLRYLKQLGFPLVFEALRERSLILDTLCPHLAKPVEFLYPLEKRAWDRAYVGTGIGVYDVLGAGKGVPVAPQAHVQEVDDEELPRRQAGNDPRRHQVLRGPARRRPAHHDDHPDRRRLRRARRHQLPGGRLPAQDGQEVVGAKVRDLETGNDFEVRAKCIVNAAGVWTDEIQHMIGGKGAFRVQASKGVHILVPRDRIPSKTGLITETEKSLLFVIPCSWSDDLWIIGTTDTPWNLDLAHPAASEADLEYILKTRQPAAGVAADQGRHRRCVRGSAAAAGR